MKNTLLTLSALCAFGLSQANADQLLTWDFFQAYSGGTTSTAGTSFSPHLFDPTLSMHGVSPVDGTGAFVSGGWDHDGISLANPEYYEFTIAVADPGWKFSLSSIDQRNSFGGSYSAAPDGVTLQWAYSLNGGAFQLINPTFGVAGSSGLTTNRDLSGISALQNVSTSVTFRLFASGAAISNPADTTDSRLGWRNISAQSYGLAVNGTTAFSAVPEPSTYGIFIGLGIGGLVLLRIRRRAIAVASRS